MKNQNDLIAIIVAFVVLLIVGIVAYAERPIPATPPAPDPVNTSEPMAPTNTQPILANALPGGGSTAGGGGGGAAGGGGSRGGITLGSASGPAGAGGGGGGGDAPRAMSIQSGGASTKAGG